MKKSKYFIHILSILLALPISIYSIIIRHDRTGEDYFDLAGRLKVVSNILFLNKTDVAGTLIKPNWVLAAVHVAEELTADDTLIHKSGKYRIDRIIIHPGWIANGPQDIALIKLEKDISGFVPLAIYEKRDEIGKDITIAGIGDFGTGKTGPVDNDGRLRAATNRVDEASDNWLKWNFEDPERYPEIVSELEGISGPGDSSGPAFFFENEKNIGHLWDLFIK